MKRCPECGFRANDKTCPLCGVRMRDLPGAAPELNTHNHNQSGEQCVLPNQKQPRRPAGNPEMPKPRPQPQPERRPEKKVPQLNISPKLLPVLAVILIALLRGCMG